MGSEKDPAARLHGQEISTEDELHTVEISDPSAIHSAIPERHTAYLIELTGSNVGEMHKITGDVVVIGRTSAAGVRVFDEGASRRHAALRLNSRGEMTIKDLESRNGTYVNGKRIDMCTLQDGDKIQVGNTTILKFTYHDDLEESFQRQMYESALRDGLTRAFNKKYFLDRLEVELRFAQRHGTELSLIIIDVDHFKLVNDTYGHLAGDEILSGLAERVQKIIRHEDTFARYGGEEFAVICRGITAEGTTAFAERIRRAVSERPFVFEGESISVTASVGVSLFPDESIGEPRELIEIADRALYVAKRSGRNQVVVGPVPDDTPPA
jgi:two-component system, cell cycle response regulator